MPEQFFHAFYFSLMVEHRCGESMAEHMWCALFNGRNPCHVFTHLIAHLVAIHPLATLGDKQGVVTTCHLLVSSLYIFAERIIKLLSEGDNTLFAAFSCNAYFPPFKIDRIIIETDQFGQSYASGVEN